MLIIVSESVHVMCRILMYTSLLAIRVNHKNLGEFTMSISFSGLSIYSRVNFPLSAKCGYNEQMDPASCPIVIDNLSFSPSLSSRKNVNLIPTCCNAIPNEKSSHKI